ncbi:hypothetical protein B4N89_16885 [Embleya scabrispora]|uniref:PE-PGRS family protein n=1 Tax=Embleya scabrispora TaxID=159449 RepID=A0A1T3P0E9_9ACTN|nr:hypothetical protein B4N89_16885 [Embleya scabrispora]
MAEVEHLPQDVIEVMVGHSDRRVRVALGSNPHVDPVQRARLLTDPDWRVVARTLRGGRHPDGDPRPLPDEGYARFLTWVMSSRSDAGDRMLTQDEMLQEFLAARDTPSHIFRSFVRRPEPELRSMACGWWEVLPPDERRALIHDPVREVRERAARVEADVRRRLTGIDWAPVNRGSESAISCRLLARVDAERIVWGDAPAHYRYYAAGNPHLPVDLVAVLGRDPDPAVRYRVSMRPELTEGQRAGIDYRVPELEDLDDAMRYDACPAAGTPETWARSAHPGVRRIAACSGGLSGEARDRLVRDPDLGVRVLTCRHQAGVTPELLLRAYRDYRGRDRGRLTWRPGFPTRGLARFADDPDPGMRELVLRDPDAPIEVVVRLLADPERCVRTALARHPALAGERLLALLDDPELGPCAAANPALPVAVMHRILDAAGVPRVP